MTDQVLDILKLVLLALLYLFFARVVWAVWSEVRSPARAERATGPPAAAPTPDPTLDAPRDARRQVAPNRGRGGVPNRLVVIEPKERRGTQFQIAEAVGIGREGDNTIVVTDDAYISAHHARVTRTNGQVVIDDLGSRNGTYLNGTRIAQQHTVGAGDRIQIGYTVLEAQ